MLPSFLVLFVAVSNSSSIFDLLVLIRNLLVFRVVSLVSFTLWVVTFSFLYSLS